MSHASFAKMVPQFLFDEEILRTLDFEDLEGIRFNPEISNTDPGENLALRPLKRDDYSKGYMDLLSQLTRAGDVSQQEFEARFDEMASSSGTYYVVVVEDTNTGRAVASTTLAVEKKFIRGCASRGRIEDVVVDENYRGRQLGKLLVLTAKKLARSVGCYKLTLDCEKSKIPFYEKFGLKNDEAFYMVHRF